MRTQIATTQGDRCLVKTVFEDDPSDPDTHRIEVIYEVHRPASEDFTLDGDPYFMERLSCTRTDTREPVKLDKAKNDEVKQAVITKVAEAKLWGTGAT
tara:strand:- start:1492 stop:1785 length:294 start_codon:yes stop_codon:yes gene_type:complete